MFYLGEQLLQTCSQRRCSISQVMIHQEADLFSTPEVAIRQRMHDQWQVMQQGIQLSLEKPRTSMGGLIGGEGIKLMHRVHNNTSLCGQVTGKAVAYAMGLLEVNASMGIVVAAPTGGSCGILPGTLKALQETFEWSDDQVVSGLFNAAAIGTIIFHNATVSGAEGGCQAETGSAAAMTASAICELMGATPETSLHAAAIALKNVMGQVCDPVAGLVESPCQKRNGLGAANALISAEMALAGITSIIPFDEVVAAMGEVGRSLPETLRETARGGIAVTPTACRLKKQLADR
ncbi:L-serine ammonia-lyase, iron-sulfur-dependent, subunit alpha [Anoxynatronum buryatiense]|uniref:L-serine dehydratase n=1 Tax=Anoxynatronum buryatiense TaxID=489973 RepID=A0AA45WU31_9CLOT|nr:L-serine ammonia-lyase, iron-sulfur-dependent, subunit alpha [Anoxynatronum buryatiense]SMP45774.1 L-serine dehydratase [Anoxynatronum buryatiense]